VSFPIFLLCTFVLLARPQDILTFLQPIHPALLVTALAVGSSALGGRLKDLSTALSTPEAKRYLLLYLIMIVGIPFATHRRLAFEGVLLGYSVNIIFFLLLVSHVDSLQRLKSIAWIVSLSTLMYSVIGGILHIGDSGGGRFEVLGTSFDPNDTAYVLVSMFPISLYFVRFNEGLLRRTIAAVVVCSSIAIILLTGSRGGVMALAAVLLIMFFTTTGGIGKGYKTLFLILLCLTWVIVGDQVDVDRYLTLLDLSSDYNVTTDEGGRIELWEAGIGLALANPITGVGVNCFEFAYFLAREAAGNTYLRWHTIHNSFLQIASEVGLVGFFIYLSISVRSFLTFLQISRVQRAARSNLQEFAEMSALGGVMLLGFLGLLVSGFFLSQGYSIFTTLYFALAAALVRLHHAMRLASTGAPQAESGTGGTRTFDARTARRMLP